MLRAEEAAAETPLVRLSGRRHRITEAWRPNVHRRRKQRPSRIVLPDHRTHVGERNSSGAGSVTRQHELHRVVMLLLAVAGAAEEADLVCLPRQLGEKLAH